MLFAQASIESLPATYWKNFCIALIVLLGVAVSLVTIWSLTRRSQKVEIEPQPMEVRKQQKRYNHDLSEQRYGDHERRIVALEKANSELISKLEQDKNEIIHAGEERETRLQTQITDLPGRIISDMVNTKKLFRAES
jgi:hypothetical protein